MTPPSTSATAATWPTGAAFTTVPLRVTGLGTISVRAFAWVPEGHG